MASRRGTELDGIRSIALETDCNWWTSTLITLDSFSFLSYQSIDPFRLRASQMPQSRSSETKQTRHKSNKLWLSTVPSGVVRLKWMMIQLVVYISQDMIIYIRAHVFVRRRRSVVPFPICFLSIFSGSQSVRRDPVALNTVHHAGKGRWHRKRS